MIRIYSPPYNNLPHKKTTAEKVEDVLSILAGLTCVALYIFYAFTPLLIQ